MDQMEENIIEERLNGWIKISKDEMTKDLQNSLNAQNTLIDISKYEDEIESLITEKTNHLLFQMTLL